MCGGVTPDRQEDLGSFIRLWMKACGCFEHLYPDALQGLDHLLQKPVFLFQDRDFGFEGLGFGEKFQEQVDKPFGMRIGSDPVGILGSGKRDP